jgi:hypothetical protein
MTMVALPRQTDVTPLYERLAEIAEEIAARRSPSPEELAVAVESLRRTSAALAVAVEDAAYALGSAPDGPPPRARRAVSWPLHGLANALRSCRELSTVVGDAVERARAA